MPDARGLPVHGDRIEIPKGAPVLEAGRWYVRPVPAGRTSQATVETVWDFAQDHAWERFLTDEEQELLEHTALRLGLRCRSPWRDAWHDGVLQFDAVKTRILSMHDGDLRFVSWGSRMAHVSHVRIVDAKPGRERSVTLRTLMTPGSVWRTTRDVRLTGAVSTVDLLRKGFARLPSVETLDGGMTRIVLTDLPAGTEFAVRTDRKLKALGRGNGLAAPITASVDDFDWYVREPDSFFQNPLSWNGLHLPLNQIEGAVEQMSGGDSRVFVLRDSETGLFFGGFTHDWAERTEHLRMVDTFASARKYASPANARASILAWTGAVPTERDPDSDRPEWVGWDAKMELPATWVLLEVDRITLEERPSDDIQSWYRARSLTHCDPDR